MLSTFISQKQRKDINSLGSWPKHMYIHLLTGKLWSAGSIQETSLNLGIWTITETQEVLSEHQETYFYCEGGQTRPRFAWRGCGVSILGDAQKLTDCGQWQLPISSLVWAGGLDHMALRNHQTSSFFDSVNLPVLAQWSGSLTEDIFHLTSMTLGLSTRLSEDSPFICHCKPP